MKNVVIWSKTNCKYCDMAKALLRSKNIVFEERKLGEPWTKDDLLAAVPTARTVPQIFGDNRLIGGYTELVKILG